MEEHIVGPECICSLASSFMTNITIFHVQDNKREVDQLGQDVGGQGALQQQGVHGGVQAGQG